MTNNCHIRRCLLQETNAQGQSVQYQYDAHGRVLQVQRVTPQAGQSPQTSALRYQWDVAGRLMRLTNGKRPAVPSGFSIPACPNRYVST